MSLRSLQWALVMCACLYKFTDYGNLKESLVQRSKDTKQKPVSSQASKLYRKGFCGISQCYPDRSVQLLEGEFQEPTALSVTLLVITEEQTETVLLKTAVVLALHFSSAPVCLTHISGTKAGFSTTHHCPLPIPPSPDM